MPAQLTVPVVEWQIIDERYRVMEYLEGVTLGPARAVSEVERR